MISVGYRISNPQGTRFRQWATSHLNNLATHGFSVDSNDPDSLRKIAAKVRELRNSERELYTRIKDVFKESSIDYHVGSTDAKRTFFATVQDKFHFAVTGKTSSQLILERVDSSKINLGMKSFKGQHPTLAEAQVGKNYLTEDELYVMNILGEQFMLFAESKAFRGQKMTMEEIATYLNTMLQMNGYQVLYDYGDTWDRGPANAKAESEHRTYLKRTEQASLESGK